jgi:hypothetical protein
VTEPVRVLLIGGWGRCGSTLLDMLLGEVPGFVSVGEVREIWLRGCVENRPCGCGAPFRECPFWSDVAASAYGGWDRLDLPDLLRTRYRLERAPAAPLLLAPRLGRGIAARIRRYTDALHRLYRAIQDVSGRGIVVDSSKMSTHALMLHRDRGIDLRVLHLVRDSRGVAFSAAKRVELPGTASSSPAVLPRHGTAFAAGRYLVHNVLAHVLRPLGIPYRLLRYEDLTKAPRERLSDVIRFAGRDPRAEDLAFLSDHAAQVQPNHLVDGNPVRFSSGPLKIRMDLEWRERMPDRKKAAVTALTWPLLVAYGYPLSPKDASADAVRR